MENMYDAMVDQIVVEEIEPFVLTIEHEEIPGLSVVVSEDRDVEREVVVKGYVPDYMGCPVWLEEKWTDDDSSSETRYFCTSGDHPVLEPKASANDKKARNINEVPAPTKDYYSTAKVSKWGNGKVQERNLHTVLGFITKNKENKALLRKGWNRFWKRVYAQEMCSFLFPSQVKLVKGEFYKYGISSLRK
jgi:hypothetical protein